MLVRNAIIVNSVILMTISAAARPAEVLQGPEGLLPIE